MIHALRAMRVGRRTWKLSYLVGLSGYPSSDRIKISFLGMWRRQNGTVSGFKSRRS